MVMSVVPQAAISPVLASDVESEEIVLKNGDTPEALSEEEKPLWEFVEYGEGVAITAYNGTATDGSFSFTNISGISLTLPVKETTSTISG